MSPHLAGTVAAGKPPPLESFLGGTTRRGSPLLASLVGGCHAGGGRYQGCRAPSPGGSAATPQWNPRHARERGREKMK
jgi:hypothetical protein